MFYFVSIHMVPLVPRGPVGKVYRDVPDAHQILLVLALIGPGKGLTVKRTSVRPRILKLYR